MGRGRIRDKLLGTLPLYKLQPVYSFLVSPVTDLNCTLHLGPPRALSDCFTPFGNSLLLFFTNTFFIPQVYRNPSLLICFYKALLITIAQTINYPKMCFFCLFFLNSSERNLVYSIFPPSLSLCLLTSLCCLPRGK